MKSQSMRLERLEDRTVPAIFGNPWPDGQHITLSLAPDGTAINGAASQLQQTLAALGGTAATMDILRAFQTWAVWGNVNVGVVADGGQDFSTGGAIQGDPRFGDVRVGARPLAGDVLAITAPFNLFGNSSGNITLNSAANLGRGNRFDLFTIFLQEAGHAFGVGNSPNVHSVMYEYYQGARTTLAADDVAALQALYGVRRPDAFEGASGNGTPATAAAYSEPIEGDITAAGDVDVFRFQVPLLASSTSIRVQSAGLSLLMSKVELLDAAGRVLSAAVSADPLHNDLTLSLSHGLFSAGTTYFVRVSGADSGVFGVGSYRLEVATRTLTGDVLGTVSSLLSELGVNELLSTATPLTQTVGTTNSQYDYTMQAALSAGNDVDYYRVHAPAAAGGTADLVAAVWGLDGKNLDPRLAVFDAQGNAVPFRVLTNDGATFILQVEDAAANADYFVRVSSTTGAVGKYTLAVDFRLKAIDFPMGSYGNLSDARPSTWANLTVVQSGTFHFVLSGSSADAGAAAEMTVRDASGRVVFQVTTGAGDARSGDVFLRTGYYTVQVRAFSRNGGRVTALRYNLDAIQISDPVGVQSADTTGSPEGSTTPGSGTSQPPPSSGSSSYWTSGSSSDGCVWF